MNGLVNSLLSQLHSWNQKLGDLSLRERVLVILTPVVASFALTFHLLSTHLQQLHTQEQVLEHHLSTLKLLKTQIDILHEKALSPTPADPLAGRLQDQLFQAESSVTSGSQTLGLMRTLLNQHPRIQLVNLKTGSPVSLGVAGVSPLFRLPVELVIRGNYPDIVVYLKQLEQLGHIYWIDLDDQVNTYPENEFHLQLFLLSQSEVYLDR